MTNPNAPGADLRVLLVDDQPLVRTGLRMVLEASPEIGEVEEAGDGAVAVVRAAAWRPDVVLMDVRMPRLDGIAATRAIVAADPSAKVVALTTFDLDEYAFGALQAGASGFLLKDVEPEQLIRSILAVAHGDAALSTRVSRRMLDLFSSRLPAERPVDGDRALSPLTPREREVFLAASAGATNGEICVAMRLSESTVKTHVGRILMKLGLRDRVHLVIYAYEHGLVGR